MKAYQGTQVNYMKSQAKIGAILAREGILDKQFTHLGSQNKLILTFKKILIWDNKKIPLGVKIEIDGVPTPTDNKTIKECDRKHRVLYHWIKTKFEAINEGLYEDVMQGFVKEFYPNLLLGNKTILERTLPEFTQAFIEGKADVNLQLEHKG
jgi:hypothetical protein